MPDYEGLKNKKRALIRKALEGSVFIGGMEVEPITALTELTGGVITLKALPNGMDDIGWANDDGAEFERDVETSDTTSWGAKEPTRSDVTQDITTMAISCQETNLRTIGLYSGADMNAVTPDAGTGEVRIVYPSAPKPKYYRTLALAVDVVDEGEIYVARFLPSAKVTDYDSQTFSSGDDPIMYPVTMTGFLDDELGYAKMDLFGGPGWNAMLADMGFTPTTP